MTYINAVFNFLRNEPLNAFSSVLFMIIVVYWVFKIGTNYRYYNYLSYVLFLLFIGGVICILYHSLYNLSSYLILDYMPIILIFISAAIYFVLRLTNWKYLGLSLMSYLLIYFILLITIGEEHSLVFRNLNYTLIAIFVFLPHVVYLVKTDLVNGKWVGFALIFLLFGVLFKICEAYGLLSIDTHFLWHTFAAVCCFCTIQYMFLMKGKQIKKANDKFYQPK